jgi:hypothetical protein
MASTQQYDLFITGGKIVTMDAERRIINNGALAISGNKIQGIFSAGEFPSKYKAV